MFLSIFKKEKQNKRRTVELEAGELLLLDLVWSGKASLRKGWPPGLIYGKIYGKSVLRRGNNRCKGPEKGLCLVVWGHHHKANKAGSQCAGQVEGSEVREVKGSSSCVTYLG